MNSNKNDLNHKFLKFIIVFVVFIVGMISPFWFAHAPVFMDNWQDLTVGLVIGFVAGVVSFLFVAHT